VSEETFERFSAAAERGTEEENRAILALQALERRVIRPLDAISRLDDPTEHARSATAKEESRRALVAGVFAALVALTSGIAFVIYAVGLVRRVRAQNDRLIMLDRVKDDFVASVSHELRTPITSIRGYLELVLDGEAGDLTDEQRQFLSIVDRNPDRLLRVVGDLLFVAQVDAGKIHVEKAPAELDSVVHEAVEPARPAAADQGIELQFDVDGVGMLNADRARLAQVVDNLISNALKFTPEGGRVTVRCVRCNDRAVLEVADTGIGIPQAEQKRMFQRFYRTTAATNRAIQGTGLGLTIVKAIVEAHDGSITFRSVPGVGTTFRVELPLERERIAA
jgi:signal transduction histidine kinase